MDPKTQPSLNDDRATALRENLAALFGVGTPSRENLGVILKKVAPEDVAAILEDFSEEDKILIFRSLPSDEARGVIIEETDQQSHDEILDGISTEEKASVLGEMSVDDIVDHIEQLPAEEKAIVLAELEPDEARDVEALSQFPPDVAGGMMTTDFLTLSVDVTSKQALTEIQGNLDAEVISYVYLVEKPAKLLGVVSIRDILRAQPSTPIRQYMVTDPITVNLLTDQEEVAQVANKYNLSVVPVIDNEGEIRGIVTVDDILDAVEEEHSEDMLRMAGTIAVHPYYESVTAGVWKRLPFLSLTMIGGLGIMLLRPYFEHDLSPSHLVLTLTAIPLLCALSGNVAIVTSTVMVRGLTTGEINLQRSWKALTHEFLIGTGIAVVMSIVISIVFLAYPALLQSSDASMSVSQARELIPAFAIGLCVSMVFAALVGAVVPVLCRMTKIDPAIASGPFVTMLCDLSAAFIFLQVIVKLLD